MESNLVVRGRPTFFLGACADVVIFAAYQRNYRLVETIFSNRETICRQETLIERVAGRFNLNGGTVCRLRQINSRGFNRDKTVLADRNVIFCRRREGNCTTAEVNDVCFSVVGERAAAVIFETAGSSAACVYHTKVRVNFLVAESNAIVVRAVCQSIARESQRRDSRRFACVDSECAACRGKSVAEHSKVFYGNCVSGDCNVVGSRFRLICRSLIIYVVVGEFCRALECD